MNILKKIFGGKDVTTSDKYESYEDYLTHQKQKTTDPIRRERWLGEQWATKVTYFTQKFEAYGREFFKPEFNTAIGLGARTGQEIEAFKNLGFEAVGIDLVPCEPLVVAGDIHDVPFEASSFDVVFTNVFDHSLYPDKFVAEIERLLKPGGIAVMHLAVGKNTDQFGVTDVIEADGVIDLFQSSRVLKSNKMEPRAGMTWELLTERLPEA